MTEIIINTLPYIKTSLVEHDSLLEIIAIWGIEGGVAKAKLASIPIIQIVALKLSELFEETNIVLATVATKVAVTIFEDKLVWIAAHKAKIIRSNIEGRLIKYPPTLFCRKLIIPILSFLIASPKAKVAAHIIKLPQGTPFLKASSIFIKGKFKATAILKVGKENSILDNWHSSILVGIKENGVLNDYGYDINLIRHERSDSGINFSGINVPYFNDMMAFVERNHKKLFPNAGIIGWDIVADNDGKITVIEINLDFPGILGEQLATCPFFEGFSKDINMLMSE